jgi:RimJ/RimL family protein N-acetyltransferase
MTNATLEKPQQKIDCLVPITPEQLPLLMRIARETFQETFEGAMDAESYTAYTANILSDDALTQAYQDPATRFMFIMDEKTTNPVGFVRYTPDTQKMLDSAQSTMRLPKKSCLIDKFYLLKAGQGTGLAKRAMQTLITYIQTNYPKLEAVHLSTWDQNTRAQKFYTRFGFILAGTVPFELSATIANQDCLYVYLFKSTSQPDKI